MKRLQGDLLWGFALLLWVGILVFPASRGAFIAATDAHPYLGGFMKFAILASMGDLLGVRIFHGLWQIPRGFLLKAVVWGVIGMMVTLVFTVFMGGAAAAQKIGRLPFADSKLALAFFGSTIMNLTFGPMMYVYHKFGDMLMESLLVPAKDRLGLRGMVASVDWYTLVSFSWLKTCLFVWIPCHTAVFLLPPEYRVLASAFLSILLGVIIAMARKSQTGAPENQPVAANA